VDWYEANVVTPDGRRFVVAVEASTVDAARAHILHRLGPDTHIIKILQDVQPSRHTDNVNLTAPDSSPNPDPGRPHEDRPPLGIDQDPELIVAGPGRLSEIVGRRGGSAAG